MAAESPLRYFAVDMAAGDLNGPKILISVNEHGKRLNIIDGQREQK